MIPDNSPTGTPPSAKKPGPDADPRGDVVRLPPRADRPPPWRRAPEWSVGSIANWSARRLTVQVAVSVEMLRKRKRGSLRPDMIQFQVETRGLRARPKQQVLASGWRGLRADRSGLASGVIKLSRAQSVIIKKWAAKRKNPRAARTLASRYVKVLVRHMKDTKAGRRGFDVYQYDAGPLLGNLRAHPRVWLATNRSKLIRKFRGKPRNARERSGVSPREVGNGAHLSFVNNSDHPVKLLMAPGLCMLDDRYPMDDTSDGNQAGSDFGALNGVTLAPGAISEVIYGQSDTAANTSVNNQDPDGRIHQAIGDWTNSAVSDWTDEVEAASIDLTDTVFGAPDEIIDDDTGVPSNDEQIGSSLFDLATMALDYLDEDSELVEVTETLSNLLYPADWAVEIAAEGAAEGAGDVDGPLFAVVDSLLTYFSDSCSDNPSMLVAGAIDMDNPWRHFVHAYNWNAGDPVGWDGKSVNANGLVSGTTLDGEESNIGQFYDETCTGHVLAASAPVCDEWEFTVDESVINQFWNPVPTQSGLRWSVQSADTYTSAGIADTGGMATIDPYAELPEDSDVRVAPGEFLVSCGHPNRKISTAQYPDLNNGNYEIGVGAPNLVPPGFSSTSPGVTDSYTGELAPQDQVPFFTPEGQTIPGSRLDFSMVNPQDPANPNHGLLQNAAVNWVGENNGFGYDFLSYSVNGKTWTPGQPISGSIGGADIAVPVQQSDVAATSTWILPPAAKFVKCNVQIAAPAGGVATMNQYANGIYTPGYDYWISTRTPSKPIKLPADAAAPPAPVFDTLNSSNTQADPLQVEAGSWVSIRFPTPDEGQEWFWSPSGLVSCPSNVCSAANGFRTDNGDGTSTQLFQVADEEQLSYRVEFVPRWVNSDGSEADSGPSDQAPQYLWIQVNDPNAPALPPPAQPANYDWVAAGNNAQSAPFVVASGGTANIRFPTPDQGAPYFWKADGLFVCPGNVCSAANGHLVNNGDGTSTQTFNVAPGVDQTSQLSFTPVAINANGSAGEELTPFMDPIAIWVDADSP